MSPSVGPVFDREDWLFCENLLAATAGLMIVLSLATRAPDPSTVRFTWYGATALERAETRASWNGLDLALSVLALAAVTAFYVAFG